MGAGQHLNHLAAGLADQLFVGVPLPVGEEQKVTLLGAFNRVVQLAEVRRAVDQGPYQVALGPRLLTGMGLVETRLRVRSLRLAEQPGRRVGHAGQHARWPSMVNSLGAMPVRRRPGGRRDAAPPRTQMPPSD